MGNEQFSPRSRKLSVCAEDVAVDGEIGGKAEYRDRFIQLLIEKKIRPGILESN
jgi:hypothetical protein